MRHFMKHAVAQDARIVHENIHAAEILDRVRYNFIRVRAFSNGKGRSHRLAARGLDFSHHRMRRSAIAA